MFYQIICVSKQFREIKLLIIQEGSWQKYHVLRPPERAALVHNTLSGIYGLFSEIVVIA